MPKQALTVAGRKLTLDARPDRLDLRDFMFKPRPLPLPEVYPSVENVTKYLGKYRSLILDQGEEGACTGFGLAAVVNYQLWCRDDMPVKSGRKVSPFMLYQLARFYDEWPGEEYEGSSCRGALKGWHKHGVCLEEFWSSPNSRPDTGWDTNAVKQPLGVYYRIDIRSVVDMQAAIYETGAIYVSANVHNGWNLGSSDPSPLTHQNLPVIKGRGNPGGHAFALVGYNSRGFIVQNSWGPEWGASGFAILPYEDWVANGSDAWTVAIGVPLEQENSKSTLSRSLRMPNSAPSTTFKSLLTKGKDSAVKGWSKEVAYEHSLVTGNDGRVINRLPHIPNAQDAVRFICHDKPAQWLGKQQPQQRKVLVYAHGGLNSEDASIERNQVLGKVFADNTVYPLFTTWKSGPVETIANILSDYLNKVLGGLITPSTGLGDLLSEPTDRLLESACRHLLVKAMWTEMKENVARGQQSGHGIAAIAQSLLKLQQDQGAEIHLVGHSAGSFVCGRLLQELGRINARANSCTLYAPACDASFANAFFVPACEQGVLSPGKFQIHLLSDERENDDNVGGAYRKSLLYLVSRALESEHKTPLIGMHNAFKPGKNNDRTWHSSTLSEVKAWQKFWKQQPDANLRVLDAKKVEKVKNLDYIAAAHGCFDNSIDDVEATLQRITGRKKLESPVTDLSY